MDTTHKILTSEERESIERRLLTNGTATHERDAMAAIYLAEKARDRRDDVEGYGYLLKAIRISNGISTIPEVVIHEYRSAAERTPKEVLQSDSYNGCLLLAKELFARQEEERAMYYLSFAASNSSADKYGVAARLMADHMTDIRLAEQKRKYEALAAKAGNPDLISAFTRKRSEREV